MHRLSYLVEVGPGIVRIGGRHDSRCATDFKWSTANDTPSAAVEMVVMLVAPKVGWRVAKLLSGCTTTPAAVGKGGKDTAGSFRRG